MFLNIYEFTREDLKSNKHGFITAGQKAWLESMASGVVRSARGNFPIGIGFALFGVCLILALFLQNEDTRALLFSGPDLFIVLILALLAVTGMMSLGIFISKRQAEKLLNAQLKSVQGVVSFDQSYSSSSSTTTYYLEFGKTRLAFGDDPSSLFKEGEKYRVFYCKAGVFEMILSYEQMGN
jgi:hypothetical protein